MKLTVFTSNQPRHLALIEKLSTLTTKTYAILECTTIFPGFVKDFYDKSEVMQRYFENVISAEKKIFGEVSFSKSNIKTLAIKSGDLNLLSTNQLREALGSDLYIIFGSSFIKGWLIDFLINQGAINIHMGLSPYYRGNSCNFWALYDNKPEYVGATIHLLSKGLDSGPMLYHAVPKIGNSTPFEFTMKAVQAAQSSLFERVSTNAIFAFKPQPQNNQLELRYSKKTDFTDSVALEYLLRNQSNRDISLALENSAKPILLSPYYFD